MPQKANLIRERVPGRVEKWFEEEPTLWMALTLLNDDDMRAG